MSVILPLAPVSEVIAGVTSEVMMMVSHWSAELVLLADLLMEEALYHHEFHLQVNQISVLVSHHQRQNWPTEAWVSSQVLKYKIAPA